MTCRTEAYDLGWIRGRACDDNGHHHKGNEMKPHEETESPGRSANRSPWRVAPDKVVDSKADILESENAWNCHRDCQSYRVLKIVCVAHSEIEDLDQFAVDEPNGEPSHGDGACASMEE
jgi:hypothetical protein